MYRMRDCQNERLIEWEIDWLRYEWEIEWTKDWINERFIDLGIDLMSDSFNDRLIQSNWFYDIIMIQIHFFSPFSELRLIILYFNLFMLLDGT